MGLSDCHAAAGVLTRGGNAYLDRVRNACIHGSLWRKHLPGPEGDEESQVREEEYTAILVDGIEYRYRLGLFVVWVDLWRTPELTELEPHCGGLEIDKSGGIVVLSKRYQEDGIKI